MTKIRRPDLLAERCAHSWQRGGGTITGASNRQSVCRTSVQHLPCEVPQDMEPPSDLLVGRYQLDWRASETGLCTPAVASPATPRREDGRYILVLKLLLLLALSLYAVELADVACRVPGLLLSTLWEAGAKCMKLENQRDRRTLSMFSRQRCQQTALLGRMVRGGTSCSVS
jgi:hypothetical protein